MPEEPSETPREAGPRGFAWTDQAAILLATAGVGYLRPAPGTWGTLLGLPLAAGCWRVGGARWALPALILMFPVLAAVCTRAAKRIGKKDPGSVVCDEYWAFAGLLVAEWAWQTVWGQTELPAWGGSTFWWQVSVLFALFRLFDIAKPWPIRRLERLPDTWSPGWGIMLDDLGAAVAAWVGYRLVSSL